VFADRNHGRVVACLGQLVGGLEDLLAGDTGSGHGASPWIMGYITYRTIS